MKSQPQNIIFALLKVVRDGDLKQANPRTHNNYNRIEFRPAVQYAYLMRFFYCAVVWVEQLRAFQNSNQKQSGKHANVSNNSAGSKAKTFNRRPSWRKLNDTYCQLNTLKCHRDVGENECLVTLLNGFILKQVVSLKMKGYKEGYALELTNS